MRRVGLHLVVLGLFPGTAVAAGDDPVAGLALWLGIVLFAAKVFGELAVRLKQPAVLGELLVGVVLGNLHHFGILVFEPMKTDPTLDMLSRLGVLLLLFEVGLESTVGDMLKVGLPSLLVAILGVVAPFGLGVGVGRWLLPDESVYLHAFLGATLTATSVGITARVLSDLKKSQTNEARVILGAAVIDDVLGIVMLAVVSGLIVAADAGATVSVGAFAMIFIKAAAFLVASLGIGVLVTARLVRAAALLRAPGVLLALGLVMCFALAYVASLLGLAPIIGAFAAGLVLEDVQYADFRKRGERGLTSLVHPITGFLTPVFFVLMGMKTDVAAFAAPGVLVLALCLTVAAIVGKLLCGLGVVQVQARRFAVGVGMVPRGEVGLIFANVGASLTLAGQPVINATTYSAVVFMVLVTTLVAPPALARTMR